MVRFTPHYQPIIDVSPDPATAGNILSGYNCKCHALNVMVWFKPMLRDMGIDIEDAHANTITIINPEMTGNNTSKSAKILVIYIADYQT